MVFAAVTTALMLAFLPVVQEQPRAVHTSDEHEVSEVGPVEVQGRRLQQQAHAFVQDVAAAPPGRTLARWRGTICIGVANLNPQYAQFMIDRIAMVASELGVEVEAPGCKPDIMIIGAADAGVLARALVADDPNGFRPASNATDLGAAALDRFQSTDAPVRWWQVSLPVSLDTGQIAMNLDGEIILEKAGGPESGEPKPVMMRVRDPSRLRANTRNVLARETVIIDVTKVGRIGFGALSDYVAMVTLAQIAPDADTSGYDTVLNLFSEGADRTAGLTQ